MAELPIIFSGPMVKALLDGQKTQTRRVVKPPPPDWITQFGYTCFTPKGHISGRGTYKDEGPGEKFFKCPYQKGQTLWVREAWCLLDYDQWWEPGPRDLVVRPGKYPRKNACAYKADETSLEGERCRKELGYRWKSPFFMPRWASRLALTVTNARVERVQEISEEDAKAEGILEPAPVHGKWCAPAKGREGHWSYRKPYADLWDALNAKRGYAWARNPWVWVVEFALNDDRTKTGGNV